MTLTEEQKRILEDMEKRIDFILKKYKKYLDALAEYDRTGVLQIDGEILYERKRK